MADNVRQINPKTKFFMECPECGGTYWLVCVDLEYFEDIEGFQCGSEDCDFYIDSDNIMIDMNSG